MSTLQSFVGTTAWGTDLQGAAVRNSAAFLAAVGQLRTPALHTPATAAFAALPNPPKIAALAALLSTGGSGPTDSSMSLTVSLMQSIGLEPLVVDWLTCGVFAFSTLDQNNGTYWAEHWRAP